MIAALQKDWPTIIAVSGAVYTLLSVINGKLPNSPAKTIIGDVLDVLSYISRADASGSIKLPGTRSEDPGVVK